MKHTVHWNGLAAPEIREDEVHVWRIELNRSWSRDLDNALSADDRNQAARFRFEKDRKSFSVARASLRKILSGYLQSRPAALQIERNAYGKPYLNNQEHDGLRFNLSHSHELALIAIARGREVGIDVEFMRRDFATEEVAEHFFSRAEAAQLASVSPELRADAFFNCWTRKEAYIKARGEGLSLPLDEFDVSLIPDSPAAMLENRSDPAELSRWSFRELFPGPGYVAALAVEDGHPRLPLYHFPRKH